MKGIKMTTIGTVGDDGNISKMEASITRQTLDTTAENKKLFDSNIEANNSANAAEPQDLEPNQQINNTIEKAINSLKNSIGNIETASSDKIQNALISIEKLPKNQLENNVEFKKFVNDIDSQSKKINIAKETMKNCIENMQKPNVKTDDIVEIAKLFDNNINSIKTSDMQSEIKEMRKDLINKMDDVVKNSTDIQDINKVENYIDKTKDINLAKYDSVKSSIENKKMECLENIKNCLPNIVEQAKNSEPNSIKGLINSLDSYKNEINMIKDSNSSKIINEKEIINNEIDKTYKILQEKEINSIK